MLRRAAILLLTLATQAEAEQQPYVFEAQSNGILEPLDVGFDPQGRVLVAAGREGLLRIEPDGSRVVVAETTTSHAAASVAGQRRHNAVARTRRGSSGS